MIVHYDCRHFKGHIPCSYHKLEGIHCEGCPHYDQVTERILIIKLGALGDVIRTTPLIEALKAAHPESQLFWLTYSPEFLPSTPGTSQLHLLLRSNVRQGRHGGPQGI